MQVYRYFLEEGENEVEMTSGAQVLGFNFTSRGLALYALVEPANTATETRTFVSVGNGEDLPDPLADLGVDGVMPFFRGTAKVPGGPTAHVFETTQLTAEVES